MLQIKASVTDFAKSTDKPTDEKINAHEGVFYLLSPDGDFRKAFGHDEDAVAIAHTVSSNGASTRLHGILCLSYGQIKEFVMLLQRHASAS